MMAKHKSTSGNGKPSAEGNSVDGLALYFLSLTLSNVRCFGPEQTLNLSDREGKPARWTIILGLNGTGKTTVLQLLAYFDLIHGDDFILPSALGTFGRERSPASHATVNVVLSNTLRANQEKKLVMDVVGGQRAGYQIPAEMFQAPPSCIGYGASRRLGLASLSETSPDDRVGTLFSDRAELRNPEEWLLQLDYAMARSPAKDEVRKRFGQAKELLLAVMPEEEITDIRLVTSRGPQPNPRAEFLTPYGWVPLRQLGYGYQTLITWVADLANRMAERYPNSPNPLAEPAVVLVDEIDLHLHPKWQRKLMSYLTERFPNTQFIATAHSPLVAQAAADANLVVLRREGDHVVIDNEVDNIRNWRIDQILTSDLFGLKTARPPQIEAQLEEREKLLDKAKLSAADKRRLSELNAVVEELPFGETAREREERVTIKKAIDALMKERKSAP